MTMRAGLDRRGQELLPEEVPSITGRCLVSLVCAQVSQQGHEEGEPGARGATPARPVSSCGPCSPPGPGL